jgi:nitrile hydratase beta subunit-like protein
MSKRATTRASSKPRAAAAPATAAQATSLQVKFQVGDRVRVRRMFPLGHVRTPWYIRGCSGVVERICGAYPNPEELAYHRSGLPAQPLYRVRFCQRDVWPDYRGNASDTVDLEIYQHWLEERQ